MTGDQFREVQAWSFATPGARVIVDKLLHDDGSPSDFGRVSPEIDGHIVFVSRADFADLKRRVGEEEVARAQP